MFCEHAAVKRNCKTSWQVIKACAGNPADHVFDYFFGTGSDTMHIL
jgi:hypothetical protein